MIHELAQRARILGLPYRPTIPQELRRILSAADEASRLLEPSEVSNLCSYSGVEVTPFLKLNAAAGELVSLARRQLLKQEPSLVETGGALYPEQRAEACWRDCFHFLRVSLYGVAVAEPDLTDNHGMQALAELYTVLAVPVHALLIALTELHNVTTVFYQRYAPARDVFLLDRSLTLLRENISIVCGRSVSTEPYLEPNTLKEGNNSGVI